MKGRTGKIIILALVVLLFLISVPVYKTAVSGGTRTQVGASAAPTEQLSQTVTTGAKQGRNRISAAGTAVKPYFTVLDMAPDCTRIRFTPGNWDIRERVCNGKTYSVITAEGSALSEIKGAPSMPLFRGDSVLPRNLPYSIEIDEIGPVQKYPCPPPLPSAGPVIYGTVPGIPEPDLAIYNSTAVYPKNHISALSAYIMRGVRGLGLSLAPFRYDFGEKLLEVPEYITFTVHSQGAAAEDYPALDTQHTFRSIQRSSFLNSALLDSSRAPTPGKLLLVVPDEWQEAAQNFIRHKQQMGYTAEAVPYPEMTGDGVNALADYLRTAYNDSGISHVILCSDADYIPPAFTSQSPEEPGMFAPTSDTLYAMVDGDDVIQDFLISRIPAQNKLQLEAMLSKQINWESNPPADDSWRTQHIFLGSNDSAVSGIYAGRTDKSIMIEMRSGLLFNGLISNTSPEIYAPSAKLSQLLTAFNSGASALYYLGHGVSTGFRTTGFDVQNAAALSNGQKLPFLLTPVCDTGNFVYPTGDCLTEALLRSSADKGASCGAIGVVASTSETYWNPPIQTIFTFKEKLLQAFTAERLTDFGAYSYASILAGIRLAETEDGDNYARYYAAQMHYFGDCSALARLCALRELDIETQTDWETVSAAVTWSDGGAVAGTMLCLQTDEGEIISSACTDENGVAVLNTRGMGGEARIVVSDPAARQMFIPVLLKAPDYSKIVDGLIAGKPADGVSILPQGITAEDVATADTLPAGLFLSSNGVLSGTPEQSGRFTFCCSFTEAGIPKITHVTTIIYTEPDADGNGLLDNHEILAFMVEHRQFSGNEEVLQRFVRQWEESGAPESPVGVTRGGIVEQTAAAAPEYSGTVEITSHNELMELQQAGAEIISAWEGGAKFLASGETLEVLKASGFSITSISSVEKTRGDNPLYPQPEQLNALMLTLAEENDDICSPEFVGMSVEGREILALRFTSAEANTPQLLIAGGIHGDERSSCMLAWQLAQDIALNTENYRDILEKAEIYILPMMNPDGCAAGRRHNSRNIDLNRDYPDGIVMPELGSFANGDSMNLAGRQPETRAMMRWCAGKRFSAALHLHTGDRLICYPYGNYSNNGKDRNSPDSLLFRYLAQCFIQDNPDISTVMQSWEYYPVVGELADWQYRYLGTLAMTAEITGEKGSGKENTDPAQIQQLWQNSKSGFLHWFNAAITGLYAKIVSAGNGKPISYASLEVNHVTMGGQVMYSDYGGQIHRPLYPALTKYKITAKAAGYIQQSAEILFKQGELLKFQITLKPSDIPGTELVLPCAKPMPLKENPVEIQLLRPKKNQPAVVSFYGPEDWTATQDASSSSLGSRREKNGGYSALFRDTKNFSCRMNLRPGQRETEEPLLSCAVQWVDEISEPVRRHWIPAEPQSAAVHLQRGWNMLGFPFAVEPGSISDVSGCFGYSGGRFTPAAGVPVNAFWVYSDEDTELTVHGWHGEMQELVPGWNLLSLPWNCKSVSAAFNSKAAYIWSEKDAVYIRANRIPRGAPLFLLQP